MSIIGDIIDEMQARANATKLEKILLEAIHSGNDGVKEFAKKHIYSWYIHELGETEGSVEENAEIEENFGK